MAGKRVTRGKAGPECMGEFMGWALGSLWGARQLVFRDWQGAARIQQTSAEALPLFPVLLGLAAGIIIFSQMFRVLLSCQKTTNSSLQPELLSPEVAPVCPPGYERGIWGCSHHSAHPLLPLSAASPLRLYLIRFLKQARKWG